MAGILPISRWKWVAEALLHSLSPVAWKILAFPRIGQSVSATNAAELHSAAAICCTWGDPYVNGHMIYLAPAQTPEAVAPFSRCISLFPSTGRFLARSSHAPALLFLKRGTNLVVICCWFDRTVQEAFLDFQFYRWPGSTLFIDPERRNRCQKRFSNQNLEFFISLILSLRYLF